VRTQRKELKMLVDEEICPGTTYHEHAKSVAAFNLQGIDYNEVQLAAEVLHVLAQLQPEKTAEMLEQLKNEVEDRELLKDPLLLASLDAMRRGDVTKA
jgi:hypothetical protein